jgi:drug/metabolite transporter (DMT)-like permease
MLHAEALHQHQRLALWAGAFTIVVWGANFSIQKHLLGLLEPAGFLFARYLILPACALGMLLHAGGGRIPRISGSDLRALAVLGLVSHTVHVGIVVYGIHLSTPFSSSLIAACGPVFTLLILRAKRAEVLSPAQVCGVAVSLVGVLVFLSDKLMAGRWQAGGGDLLMLFAALCFSWYTVAAKPLTIRLGARETMAWSTLLGSAPLVVVSAPGAMQVDWGALPPGAWALLGWAVVVSAFVGWIVWAWVNVVRGVARTAPLMYLMPPVAGLIAWVVTGEEFRGTKLIGATVTLAGVALAQFAGRPARAA